MTRCQPAAASLMERIALGIERPLRHAIVVKSRDFKKAYFVAALVDLGNETRIGVWTTNDLDDGGLTYSVNEVALEHSDWGLGPRTKARFSMDDDGAQEAYDCASRAAEAG